MKFFKYLSFSFLSVECRNTLKAIYLILGVRLFKGHFFDLSTSTTPLQSTPGVDK